jgi:hypothetical protein
MPAPALATLLTQLGTRVAYAEELASFVREPSPLPLGPALDEALPDGGLPRGVIELAARGALGGATSVAIAAVRAAQERDPRAWCAWLDPEGTLYAPGLARAGVDLGRLLIVRAPREQLARVAVKVCGARAFDVVVIDMDPILGADGPAVGSEGASPPTLPLVATPMRMRSSTARVRSRSSVMVRRLALLAEEGGTRVLLVTDRTAPRRAPWPVALRLELERAPESVTVRVAKDKRGRIGEKVTIAFWRMLAREGSHDA